MDFWQQFVKTPEHQLATPKPICPPRVIGDSFTRRFPHQRRFMVDAQYHGLYLTRREAHTVYYLLRGKTMRETALRMGLSPRTIEYYLNRVKQKLGERRKACLIERLCKTALGDLLLFGRHHVVMEVGTSLVE